MTKFCGHQQNLHPLQSKNRPIHPRIRMLRCVSRIQQNQLKSDPLIEVTRQVGLWSLRTPLPAPVVKAAPDALLVES